MKILAVVLVGLLATSWVGAAVAQDSGVRNRPAKAKIASRTRSNGYRRPTTVDARGLCQRDNGKPDSELNFKNVCDTEEFWARLQERGISDGDN